jgi:hypothetical protein
MPYSGVARNDSGSGVAGGGSRLGVFYRQDMTAGDMAWVRE